MFSTDLSQNLKNIINDITPNFEDNLKRVCLKSMLKTSCLNLIITGIKQRSIAHSNT